MSKTKIIRGSSKILEYSHLNEKLRLESAGAQAVRPSGDQKVAPTGSIPYVTAEYLDMVDDLADPTLPMAIRRRYDEILNPTKSL